MIRTSITPDKTDILLSIPAQYVGKKLEILLYAEEELAEAVQPQSTMAQFWNTLSDETAQDLRTQAAQSRQEWDRT